MKNTKTRKMSLLITALTALTALAPVSCAPESETETGGEKHEVQFYSAANPGIWESRAADHEPEITITKADEIKTINVSIPFASQRDLKHYVEAIVVLDLQRNELKKVSFAKGKAKNGAKFDFPIDYYTPVYVVMKCNKHDMWEKLVDWSE